ncbi:probable E3 ubiquitin-protein ligase RZFP34 isoform X2 [Macadamia integrifolia]|uniref:probable E3 ubiquitin-protein ligase RZFP34 isoform X2 n=1 Tax=Macadamia integrifolia TaxID=60698 RepID=UPI001C4F0464|nr:probable E3 ubiquitin-protein ligase RZFP34 isoform X2 [Macadamia integrifolia]
MNLLLESLTGALQRYLDCVLSDFNWSAAVYAKATISCSVWCVKFVATFMHSRCHQKTLHLMEEYLVKHSTSLELDGLETIKDNEHMEPAASDACSEQSNGGCILEEEARDNLNNNVTEKGLMEYGCSHYQRRCRIRAPCCNEIFYCRHCHNESKNNIKVERAHRHDLPRHQVRQVICSLCGTEQEVQQFCINCGVCIGKYFCEICKLFDDDMSKKQFHCHGCGICRIGGRENFFHCYKCGCCYSVLLKNSHPCVERAMDHDCPVCFEYLFESTNDVIALPCGHTIHEDCFKEMQQQLQYACPLCSKSVCDMSKVWEKFDMEIAATPMPESYNNKMVWILCNDCGATTQVQFHVVAQKCLNCKSYNTRQTRETKAATSSMQ